MKRRLFSILLVLCMTLAMLPAAAFAKSVSYNGEIIIENFGWLFLNNDEVGYYIPGKSERFRSIPPDAGPYLKVTKTGENEITITVFGNVTLQGKEAISFKDANAIKSIKNLIITGAADGKNTLSLSTTTRGTAISVLGDLTVTGIALTATAGNGHALRANNITVSDTALIATNNSAHSAAIQATQGDGPLGNLTVSGTSAITVTNKNANGHAIHATIINGNETPGQTDASQVTISSPAPHSHVCSDGWTSDATGHWHRCTDVNCTEKLNFAAHTGGTATCTAKKVCTVCGEPYGELNPSNHTALSDWASDETHHWKTCSACSTDIEKATHSGGAATCTEAKKCEICNQSYGEFDPNNHTHLSGWASDKTHHWKTCSVCSTDIEKTAHTYSEWQITQKATVAEAGAKCRECSVCHYKEMATIPSVPCTHERSTPWEPAGDGVHHVKKCADCGAIIEKAAHSGGAATCTAKKKCTICGEPYGELNPSNHTALSDWKFDETDHWKTCSACSTDIEKTAHSGGTATCNAKKTCTVCGEPYGGLDTSNHTALSGWKFDETGHWKTCNDCGTIIEKAAHSGGAATCTKAKKCEVCGQSYSEPDPNNHTHLSGWASDETHHWKTCSACNTDIEKSAHTYGDWIIDKEATATEAGSRHKVCTICNYETQTETIPATGPCTHEGSTWEPADDGVHHVKKCADCGAEPAIKKHNFAYCDNMDGFHTMTCDVCKVSYTQEHDFSHKTVPAEDGKHRGQCVCGAFDAAKEHTFENGSCTACGAADPTPAKPTPGGSGIIITPEVISPEAAGPVFLSGANQTVAVGGSAVFRIDYSYAAFRSVAVDGVTLTPADYTTWEGSTWVKLIAACTKSLTPGTHTLSVYFDGATAATTFTVGGQPNPATGARDAVGITAAAAAIALLGSAALLRKK